MRTQLVEGRVMVLEVGAAPSGRQQVSGVRSPVAIGVGRNSRTWFDQ